MSKPRSRTRECTGGNLGRSKHACSRTLSGYTMLTEESGDEVAAQVSLKLAELVNEMARSAPWCRREDAG